MKLIKFDLPIDGVKVKNIEELREHFTVEIIEHYKSGLLRKWLLSRGLEDEVGRLDVLEDESSLHELFKGLCDIFGIEIDDSIIKSCLNDAPKKSSLTIYENIKNQDETNITGAPNEDNQSQEIENQNRFMVDEKGLALDTTTGLTWCRYSAGQYWDNGKVRGIAKRLTWDEAISLAESINRSGVCGGFNDWRLPTISELESIFEEERNPPINQVIFPETPSEDELNDGYWSSTSSNPLIGRAMHYRHFCMGMSLGGSRPVNRKLCVRFVRNS